MTPDEKDWVGGIGKATQRIFDRQSGASSTKTR